MVASRNVGCFLGLAGNDLFFLFTFKETKLQASYVDFTLGLQVRVDQGFSEFNLSYLIIATAGVL